MAVKVRLHGADTRLGGWFWLRAKAETFLPQRRPLSSAFFHVSLPDSQMSGRRQTCNRGQPQREWRAFEGSNMAPEEASLHRLTF